MISFPNAKINIGLNVTGKRKDGYHTIESIFYPIGLCDILEIIKSNDFSFSSSGINIPNETNSNLCVKAYNLLTKNFNLAPVKIHLHKIIPIGAGLGGGSSDAAFVLKELSSIFNLNLDDSKFLYYSEQLGSDCAFFSKNNACYVSGKGDVIEPIHFSLKGKYIVLVYPNIHISTQEAYSLISPKPSLTELKKDIFLPIEQWKDLIKNDFEISLFKKYPILEAIKNTLYEHGAEYASMSGSGSSIFGIFNDAPNKILLNKFIKDYFIWTEKLL